MAGGELFLFGLTCAGLAVGLVLLLLGRCRSVHGDDGHGHIQKIGATPGETALSIVGLVLIVVCGGYLAAQYFNAANSPRDPLPPLAAPGVLPTPVQAAKIPNPTAEWDPTIGKVTVTSLRPPGYLLVVVWDSVSDPNPKPGRVAGNTSFFHVPRDATSVEVLLWEMRTNSVTGLVQATKK